MATDFAPHNMSANNAPSPFVASASSEYSDVFSAFKAFDNIVNNYWLANTSTGWLKLDTGLNNTHLLDNYSVRVNAVPEPNRAPKSWTLEGSKDNSNWDVLDTVTNQTSWNSGETRNFNCDDKIEFYRYFRINITANNGDGILQVAELYFFEILNQEPLNFLKYRGRNRFDMTGVSLG